MTESRMERLMAIVLAIGVAVSALLVGIGFAASLFVGWTGSLTGSPTPPTATTDFTDLAERLVAVQPLALAQAGLIVLIATPVVRVAVTAIGFWRQRDRLYVALTLLVLALLLISLGLLR